MVPLRRRVSVAVEAPDARPQNGSSNLSHRCIAQKLLFRGRCLTHRLLTGDTSHLAGCPQDLSGVHRRWWIGRSYTNQTTTLSKVTGGTWYGFRSLSSYVTTFSVGWGGSNYTAVKGDYDADGKADLATCRWSDGAWIILLSGSNYTTSLTRTLGGLGHVALPRYP